MKLLSAVFILLFSFSAFADDDLATQKAKELKAADSFRKSLKEADDTNCGPVIEVKEKLVKVSFAVKEYGNEHWIKRDQIFPTGYDCRFNNGEYQPPNLKVSLKEDEKTAKLAEEEKLQGEVSDKFVFQGGLIWMPINDPKMNWSQANEYCGNTEINGKTGWRLPTNDELKFLYDSGAMTGKGWMLGFTWSSTVYSTGRHYSTALKYYKTIADNDRLGNYVTCVR
jgi:hypothetical protein